MPTTHALELPEIAALVAAHLNAQDHLSCSSVSKALRSSFGPLAWQALSVGQPNPWASNPPLGYAYIRAIRDPFDMSHWDTDCIMMTVGEDDDPLEDLRSITPWIRSLFIRDHSSSSPLTLGASCNHLETIHLPALSVHEISHTATHWTHCEKMMQQNQSSLKSLLLTGWGLMPNDHKESIPGQPTWNPILTCTHAWNLESLTLVNCEIRKRDMPIFWTICRRLETLCLDDLHLVSTTPMTLRGSHAAAESHGSEEELPTPAMQSVSCQDSSSTKLISFPKMKELRLRNVRCITAMDLLHNVIRHCPALQRLSWHHMEHFVTVERFCELLEEGTWPELDSILVIANLKHEMYERLLRSIKRPLRQLSAYNRETTAETFELYRPHFGTLEKLDLRWYNGNTSTAAIQVLSSCPNLKSFLAKGVHAQDILNTEEGNRPWVCHGLKELGIFIDMGFENNGSYRRFTDDELNQCQAIFRRLATFKQLRSLDMLSCLVTSGMITMPRSPTVNLVGHTLVPLPFRLGAGLDELARLSQLVDVRFWAGSHVIFKKEIVWMVDHWKHLRNIGAGQSTIVEEHVTPGEASWRIGITPLLHGRCISTHGSCVRRHVDWESISHILEDCCGEKVD